MTTMTKPDHSAKNGQLEVLDRKQRFGRRRWGGLGTKQAFAAFALKLRTGGTEQPPGNGTPGGLGVPG